jgi:hypothetical protein
MFISAARIGSAIGRGPIMTITNPTVDLADIVLSPAREELTPLLDTKRGRTSPSS